VVSLSKDTRIGIDFLRSCRDTNPQSTVRDGERSTAKSISSARKAYYGRGFVQLTWKYNYEAMGRLLRIDLVANPEIALKHDVAAQILLLGKISGIFTGKKLADYFNVEKEDWVNARRIVDRLDKAVLISSYAKQYYGAISHTT
jgi:putative chitinase